MPRPKVYPNVGHITNFLRGEKIVVKCPRCGEEGLLKGLNGYLVVRHYRTTHLVSADKIPEVINSVREEIENRIKSLQALLELASRPINKE